MSMTRKPLAVLAAVTLAVSLAACGGGGNDDSTSSSGGGGGGGEGTAGGTAVFFNGVRNTEHWDPSACTSVAT